MQICCANCKHEKGEYLEACGDCIHGSNFSPNDIVNHPSHYTQGKYETIDVIEDWQLEYHEANAIKYISRAKYKGKRVEDLKKARWYIDRKIKLLEE